MSAEAPARSGWWEVPIKQHPGKTMVHQSAPKPRKKTLMKMQTKSRTTKSARMKAPRKAQKRARTSHSQTKKRRRRRKTKSSRRQGGRRNRCSSALALRRSHQFQAAPLYFSNPDPRARSRLRLCLRQSLHRCLRYHRRTDRTRGIRASRHLESLRNRRT